MLSSASRGDRPDAGYDDWPGSGKVRFSGSMAAIAVGGGGVQGGKVLAFLVNLPACLVGMEACAGAHRWARELRALGHEVRLMPPHYVRPCVKRSSETDQRMIQ